MRSAAAILVLGLAFAAPAHAQEQAQPQEQEPPQDQTQPPAQEPSPPRPLLLEHFVLDAVPMREAFERWSAASGTPLVVQWDVLAEQGLDTTGPISLDLTLAPPMLVLRLMMMQATADGFHALVLENHGAFVELLTRRQALRRPIVRVYDIRDLLVNVPRFTGAPSLSLGDALSNDGGDGGGGRGIFGDETGNDQPRPLSRAQQGERIAQLIRDTIEPDIWIANGGRYAAIRYYDGRLIVRAPQYVHGAIRQRL